MTACQCCTGSAIASRPNCGSGTPSTSIGWSHSPTSGSPTISTCATSRGGGERIRCRRTDRSYHGHRCLGASGAAAVQEARWASNAERGRLASASVSTTLGTWLGSSASMASQAVAVWADTPDDERGRRCPISRAGRCSVVFSVDLFNEGVDVPAVDILLMLRPTDSPVLFLAATRPRPAEGARKGALHVLDFVGQHRKEFRYDRRFQALLGGKPLARARQVSEGFPFLPSGCSMQLDRVATERVLESIKNAVPSRWSEKANELRSARDGSARPSPLATFSRSQVSNWRMCTQIVPGPTCGKQQVCLQEPKALTRRAVRRAIGRLLHVDDPGTAEHVARLDESHRASRRHRALGRETCGCCACCSFSCCTVCREKVACERRRCAAVGAPAMLLGVEGAVRSALGAN